MLALFHSLSWESMPGQQSVVAQVDVDVLVHGVESGVGLLGIVDEVFVVGLLLSCPILSFGIFAIVAHVDVNLRHFDVWAFIAGVEVKLVALFVGDLRSDYFGVGARGSCLMLVCMHTSWCSWSLSRS